MTQEPEDPTGGLTHVGADGSAHMVDVGDKSTTRRTAVAGSTFHTTTEVTDLLTAGRLPKGDVLATARVAAIMAAKQTSSLIPLCHQLALSAVDVRFEVRPGAVEVTATVSTTDRTGVEMEALTSVAVAGLTLHDMVKALDPHAHNDGIRLLEKTGGRRGHWTRTEGR